MAVTPADIQSSATDYANSAALFHAVVHGANGTIVQTESGPVPSLATLVAQLSEEIVSGFAAGFVAVATNDAARSVLTPTQLSQLMIQTDTKAIYYGTSIAPGGWTLHPVAGAVVAANAATAAVATLTASLGGKMAAADFVGGAAASSVQTAVQILMVAQEILNNPGHGLRVYGVKAGVAGLFPAALPNGAGALVDGVSGRTTAMANTSRRCLAIGTNFALMSNPQRLVSWGAQAHPGLLASGTNGVTSHYPRAVLAAQQPARNLPGFDPHNLNTQAGQIVRICSQGAATLVLTADGLVLASGAAAQGVYPLFGSGVDVTQPILMPLFFPDANGANIPIKFFDAVDSTATTTTSNGVFVDITNNVWIVGTNPSNAGYGQTPPLTAATMKIPVKLNAGFPSWDGKVVKKVRIDTSGGVYILFTNGELWAGGGSNATGLLGTGSTTNLSNLLQIQTAVDDFEISGHGANANLALWILQGTTLKAAGYGAVGQFNQHEVITGSAVAPNKPNFVTVDTLVNLVRIGGTDTVTVIYRKTTGTWYGVGLNTDGQFGENVTARINTTARILVNLTNLIATHGALVDLVISGYASKIAVCAVFTDGRAFACGNNTDGILANGILNTASKVWTEVIWAPLDNSEKIIDVSGAISPSSGPAFTWLTNYGRVLQAGASTSGFATGLVPTVAYNVLSAQPVQLNGVL